MTTAPKRKQLYVTKLQKGQVVKTPKSSFTVKADETSIYIPEDITLKAGDKLYLNPIKGVYEKLAEDGKMSQEEAESRIQQCKEYNQSHIVSIYSKK